ncbi:hypothetical protein P22_0447 [Propionispora sp. 2/2-37]|uniref:transposase n=1 Tax=Propionispora sp. 2/2-37 TaxID=1677858 RepID=UPI0006BB8EB6|nr:transposase [Propionispora sp. 2/2-37]CUH94381.1 hypothetical protein P22_0447 [Propionispora sp. 2/2-37]
MPRSARKKSASGIYHAMVRGINRQGLFFDQEDYQCYLDAIQRTKEDGRAEIYGYCLMDNHVHLLLQEKEEELGNIMKRIGVTYAWWYNKKYDHYGHIFQDRYQSQPVEDNAYLLSVLRYIHNNPVKSRMVSVAEEYPWSSCKMYYGETYDTPSAVANTSFVLKLLDEHKEIARGKFKDYMRQENSDIFLDVVEKVRKSDDGLCQEIEALLGGRPVMMLKTMEKEQRDAVIRQIKQFTGVTQRQIARVLGINQSIVFKA